ncbi:MAG TPA: hypothetical protein VL551_25440 [Actinospica sp.]|nr:hypothetical protein [Actinospica sp.]
MSGVGRVAALGEAGSVEGFALAGVVVLPAAGREAVLAAWRELPADVEVVILSDAAARILEGVADGGRPLTVVMPK